MTSNTDNTLAHHDYGPSNYPAWDECPHYEGCDGGEDANIGTQAHELLYRAFTGAIDIYDLDATADIDASLYAPVVRAYAGIQSIIAELFKGEDPDAIFYERRVSHNGTFIPEKPFGTADVIAYKGDHIVVVDYKHRFSDREYGPQLAAYASFFAEEFPAGTFDRATLVVWYGDTGSYNVDSNSLALFDAITYGVCDKRRSRANKPCHASPWCDLCKFCGSCTESVKLVHKCDAVVPASIPSNFILPAEKMADMLAICSALTKRIDAIKKFCRDYAVENGGILDEYGNLAYEAKEAVKRYIDIPALFQLIKEHVSPLQLIEACTITQDAAKTLLKPFYKASEIKAMIEQCSTVSSTTTRLERVKR